MFAQNCLHGLEKYVRVVNIFCKSSSVSPEMTRYDHLIKENHQFLISNGALCKVWLKLGWRRYENIKCLQTEDDNDRQATVSEQLIETSSMKYQIKSICYFTIN